jgi:hypothetical protein
MVSQFNWSAIDDNDINPFCIEKHGEGMLKTCLDQKVVLAVIAQNSQIVVTDWTNLTFDL